MAMLENFVLLQKKIGKIPDNLFGLGIKWSAKLPTLAYITGKGGTVSPEYTGLKSTLYLEIFNNNAWEDIDGYT